MDDFTILYRPCGPIEMQLIKESGFKKFPPRLPEQPTFYPVCNEQYALEISEWNKRHCEGAFVVKFKIKNEFINNYEKHTVGAKRHEEYWIPAEDLEKLNDAIIGIIEVI
jgi:hypothetical protein